MIMAEKESNRKDSLKTTSLRKNSSKSSTAISPTTKGKRAIDANVPLQYPARRTLETNNTQNQSKQDSSCNIDAKVDNKLRVLSVEYGGLWRDVYEELHHLQDAYRNLQEENAQITEINKRLTAENSSIGSQFKRTLCSLTETESFHLESLQILEQIRNEKEALLSRIIAYESHQQWLEKQHSLLEKQLSERNRQCDLLETQCDKMNIDIDILQKQLQEKEIALQRQEGVLLRAQELLQESETANEKLTKALKTKNDRFAALTKEKNLLLEENKSLREQQLPTNQKMKRSQSVSKIASQRISSRKNPNNNRTNVTDNEESSETQCDTSQTARFHSPPSSVSRPFVDTPQGVSEAFHLLSPPEDMALPRSPLPRSPVKTVSSSSPAKSLDIKSLLKRFQRCSETETVQYHGEDTLGDTCVSPKSNPWHSVSHSRSVSATRMSARKKNETPPTVSH